MGNTIKKSNGRCNHKQLTIENETGCLIFETDIQKETMYVASRTASFVLSKSELKKVAKFFEHIIK